MRQISIHYSDGNYSYRDETYNTPEWKAENSYCITNISDETFELWEAVCKASALVEKQLMHLDNEIYRRDESNRFFK